MAKSKKQDKKLKGSIKAASHVKSSLDVIKPKEVIKTSASDISVVVYNLDNMTHENIYDGSIPSDVMAISTAAELGFPSELSYQEKFIHGVEQVKGKYVTELELEIGLPKWPLLKFKIKRAPEKIIKFFKAKEAKRKSNK